MVPEPMLCGEETFYVSITSFCNWGSDHQGPYLGLLSNSQSPGPMWFLLWVVSLLDSLVCVSASGWARTHGLAEGPR